MNQKKKKKTHISSCLIMQNKILLQYLPKFRRQCSLYNIYLKKLIFLLLFPKEEGRKLMNEYEGFKNECLFKL